MMDRKHAARAVKFLHLGGSIVFGNDDHDLKNRGDFMKRFDSPINIVVLGGALIVWGIIITTIYLIRRGN